jgi:hypothetical protein
MSFTNQVVSQLYVGDGSNVTFAFPFYYVPGSASTVTKVYSVDPVTGFRTVISSGYALLPLPPPGSLATPTNVVFTIAPVAGALIQVVRESPVTQGASLSNTGPFPAKTLEKAFDSVVEMIQENANALAQVLKFTPQNALSPIIPLGAQPGYALVVNPAGNGFIFAPGPGPNLLLNTQTASYTLALSDAGKFVRMNVAGVNTLTVPPNSAVPFPVGTLIRVGQPGAGQTTITAGAGVTINSANAAIKTAFQYSVAELIKTATDTWTLFGGIA